MIRRKFLQLMTLSSAGALVSLEAVAGGAVQTIVLQVKGFTCITCAVGLDTMLERTKGVVSSHSTYPEGKVTVRFNANSDAENAIRAVIADAGFVIQAEHRA